MDRTRIERLRDKLLRQGRPSIVPSPWPPPAGAQPKAGLLYRRMRPLAEAMYLVITADSQIGEQERDALRGALRILTDGALSGAALDAMLDQFGHELARDGMAVRLDHVAAELYGDPDDVELALMLVAAAALADGHSGEAELETIGELGARLGVSRDRLRALIA